MTKTKTNQKITVKKGTMTEYNYSQTHDGWHAQFNLDLETKQVWCDAIYGCNTWLEYRDDSIITFNPLEFLMDFYGKLTMAELKLAAEGAIEEHENYENY